VQEQANFWGCEGFLPNFSKLARKVLGDFACKFFSLKDHEDHFWDDLQKRSSCVFLQTLGAILLNQTRLGAILPGFSEILPRFLRILPQIFNKSKLLGVRLHPASYTTG